MNEEKELWVNQDEFMVLDELLNQANFKRAAAKAVASLTDKFEALKKAFSNGT